MKSKKKKVEQLPAAPAATKAPWGVGKQVKRSQSNDGSDGENQPHPHFNHPPLPANFELTQIAALLAGNSSPWDAQSLATKALQLWDACNHELATARSARGLGISADIWERCGLPDGLRLEVKAFGGPPPCPEEWPCSFDAGLRLLLPKQRTKGDRYAKLRAFLKVLIAISKKQAMPPADDTGLEHDESGTTPNAEVTLDDIESEFKYLKERGFRNQEEYTRLRDIFWLWLRCDKFAKMSEQRAQAAMARWNKHPSQGHGSQERRG